MRRTCTLILLGSLLLSAQSLRAQQAAEDNLEPAQFTEILKESWTFLKDETDAYLASISEKGEFETTPEYEARVLKERQLYSIKIANYIKEEKLDTRTFGVLLKARPHSYNADKNLYMVACSVQIEAPYTIPSLLTFVPTNKFMRVQDTIVGGYRTSMLKLRFNPYFRWNVDRPVAMEANEGKADLYFRVRVMIDISQQNMKKQALLRIVPKEIMLTNTRKGTVYWREEIK